MRHLCIIFTFLAGFSIQSLAQVGISDGANQTIDSNALLDIQSTALTKKGVLIPRMTTAQRTSIPSPSDGLIVYDTDKQSIWYYFSSDWHEILKGGGSTNNLTVESDGTLLMNGSATVFDDMLVPFTQAKQGTNLKPSWDETNIGFLFPQNDATAKVYLIVQLSHSYKEGSDVNAHIHWQQTTGTNGIPTWKMDYKWFNNDETVPAAFTTISTNSAVNTYNSGNQAQISSFGAITGAANSAGEGLSPSAKKISSLFLVRVYRDDNTVTGNVLGFQFDIHYEKNTIGSHSLYSK